MLAVNLQINHITLTSITAHGTVDKLLRRSQFVVIQGVIFGDGINSDRRIRMGIEGDMSVLRRSHVVAHTIVASYPYPNVVITFMKSANGHRHFIVQVSVRIRINGACIMFALYKDIHLVANLGIFSTHCSGNQCVTVRFDVVHHIITGNGVNGLAIEGIVIDMHRVFGGDNNFVTRPIMRGDGRGKLNIVKYLTFVIAERRGINGDAEAKLRTA